MLIFIVFLVSVNILIVKTENAVVKVNVKEDTKDSCMPQKEYRLVYGTNFNLEVSSKLFIISSTFIKCDDCGECDECGADRCAFTFRQRCTSYWTIKGKNTVNLKNLENSIVSVTYNKTIHANGPNVTYKYTHTGVFDKSIEGEWTFSFKYLKDYDPWTFYSENDAYICTCSITVVNSSYRTSNSLPGNEANDPTKTDLSDANKQDIWLFYVLPLCGLFLVMQSSYIIYGKVKGRWAKTNNDEDPISPKSPKGKRSKNRRNIADRPPLPLPSHEVPTAAPPQPPISPGAIHKHLFPTAPPMPIESPYSAPSDPVPLVSKPSYRHHGLNTSNQGVTSPVFDRRQQGPLVPKQSYKNEALEDSLEELKTPGCVRRHMDVSFAPKQSYRNKALDASVEEVRTPPRRNMDGPLVPNQSFRGKALDATLDELRRTPGCSRRYMDGPIVPKPAYRNSICVSDDSDEEHKSPGFARRQIEAKFAQIPPKGVGPSTSFKLPRPLPRSPPSPTLDRVPPFNPAHRPEPVPPLLPKKVPVFPPPAPFRKQEPSRMSDDEWQYEQLQPSSKYLNNNFSTTNNYSR